MFRSSGVFRSFTMSNGEMFSAMQSPNSYQVKRILRPFLYNRTLRRLAYAYGVVMVYNAAIDYYYVVAGEGANVVNPDDEWLPMVVRYDRVGKPAAALYTGAKVSWSYMTPFAPRNFDVIYAKRVPNTEFVMTRGGRFAEAKVAGIDVLVPATDEEMSLATVEQPSRVARFFRQQVHLRLDEQSQQRLLAAESTDLDTDVQRRAIADKAVVSVSTQASESRSGQRTDKRLMDQAQQAGKPWYKALLS